MNRTTQVRFIKSGPFIFVMSLYRYIVISLCRYVEGPSLLTPHS